MSVDRMDPEECLRHGGHCWKDTVMVLPYNRHHFPESCRHCTARRVATEADPWKYEMLEPAATDSAEDA